VSGLYLSQERRARGELRPWEARSVRGILDYAADRLAEMQKVVGISQRQFGARIGTTQATVSHVLNRRWSNALIGTLVRMASAVGGEVVVTIRWRNPLVLAADPSGTIFKCTCGGMIAGATGEVATGSDTKELDDSGRWRLWTTQGAPFGEEVARHVLGCPQGRQCYVMEYM
jgi:predicted XRE-type DNA-binding protein